jgi:hypothetical protein
MVIKVKLPNGELVKVPEAAAQKVYEDYTINHGTYDSQNRKFLSSEELTPWAQVYALTQAYNILDYKRDSADRKVRKCELEHVSG